MSPASGVRAATAVERSDNRKLGAVSATYVSQGSCPRDCPFYGAGCYAEYGFVSVTTRRLNDADGGLSAGRLALLEAAAIDGLSGRRPMRLHVVGDCRTNAAARTVGAAARRYAKRGGQRVWTYTHAWRRVRRESWGEGVSVLASCETPQQVREAQAAGYATAMVVPTHKQAAAYDHGGVKVVPCPAQTRVGVTCESCRLCWDDGRLRRAGLTIAFAAHSQGERQVLRSLPVV